MKTSIISTNQVNANVPPGAVPGKYKYILTDTSSGAWEEQIVDAGTVSSGVTFQVVEGRSYSVSACRLDTSGNEISQPATTTFSVPAPAPAPAPSTMQVPGTLSVSIV